MKQPPYTEHKIETCRCQQCGEDYWLTDQYTNMLFCRDCLKLIEDPTRSEEKTCLKEQN